MVDFAYTTVPGKIKPLLDKVRQVGIPPKAGVQWLKSLGFKSSNDATLLGIVKAVGLVDASSVPTSVWSAYRGGSHKKILGEAIRNGYAELFAVYPDAWQRPSTELEHVFATSTNAGKQVIAKTVASFKALCDCAEFGSPDDQPNQSIQAAGPLHAPVTKVGVSASAVPASSRPTPSVHIDLQIHVSPEASADQIDQIFKSMAKHLYGAKD